MDFGTSVECNNCGKTAMFRPPTASDQKRGRTRSLPEGWMELPNTVAGTAHFDGKTCQDNWTGSREWYRAPVTVAGIAPPEPVVEKPEEPLLAPQPESVS